MPNSTVGVMRECITARAKKLAHLLTKRLTNAVFGKRRRNRKAIRQLGENPSLRAQENHVSPIRQVSNASDHRTMSMLLSGIFP